MRAVKRCVITMAEVAVEALLWGCFVGGILATGLETFWYGVVGSVLAIPVLLFLQGYYLTRILAGLLLRAGNRWLYPGINCTLFAIHMSILYLRLKPDMTALGNSAGPIFIIAGACIVFICASGGNRLLRKWK